MAVARRTMTGAPAPGRAVQSTERVQAQERPPALPALTGLRFVAALWVVVHHFGQGVVPAGPLLRLVSVGYQSVSLFFVLSGFVLTYSYTDRASGRLRGRRRAFWLARVARLYPVYLLAFALAAAPFFWAQAQGHLWPSRATPWLTGLAALGLVQAWLPYSATAWNTPAWSLSVEAFFYALFPFLIAPLARLRTRGLLCAGLVVWVAGLAAPVLYMGLNPDHLADVRAWNLDAYWLHVVEFLPLLHLPEFVLGAVAARLFVRAQVAGAARWPWAGLSVAIAGGSVALLAAGAGLPFALLHTGLLAPVFALLLFGLAWGRGPLARVLACRLLVRLGEASYALYILHYACWEWLVRLLGVPWAAAGASGPFVVLYVGLALALALGACQLVEGPARRALLRAGAPPAPCAR